ncbi:polymer-forming cytoskeletal protein [Candidatus Uhrbacteria bacterium]|nr:polymer-forming cytoskeletal protein [Candidatus Uhrbacteria bacterium]
MFRVKSEQSMPQQSSNETIIAQGVKVEGDFHSQGDVVIDGEVNGSIETTQALTIGQSARIHADVTAKSAVIAGEVKGNIHASERLELLATSVIQGDVETQNLSIATGARVNGKITMGEMEKTE